MTIEFYRANEKPYGVFSNLSRRTVIVLGMEFPTAEHAYQYLKPRDTKVRDWLMSAPSPSLLAVAAHSLLGFHIRPGWSRLRYPWMMQCLRSKFDGHPDLREILLATGQNTIIEAGKIDDDAGRRWGMVNGFGQNYLGRMLMRLRFELGGPSYFDEDLEKRFETGAEYLKIALEKIPHG